MSDWVPVGPGAPTIGDYGLLSNCRASALVSRGGSVDWACMPSFDSPAMFARLLGEPGGYFSISPTEPAESRRAYIEDTMVLRTDLRGNPTVRELLGHATIEMTMRYAHLSPDARSEAVQVLDKPVPVASVVARPEAK